MKTKFYQLLMVLLIAATFTSCMRPYYGGGYREHPRERYHHYDHDRNYRY